MFQITPSPPPPTSFQIHHPPPPPPPPPAFQLEVDATFDKEVKLTPGKVTLVVATFSIRNYWFFEEKELPPSETLPEFLGLGTSHRATDKLWLDRIELNGDNEFYDLCTSATCLEQILNVTSMPVRRLVVPPPPPPPFPNPPPKPVSQPRDETAMSPTGKDQAESSEISKIDDEVPGTKGLDTVIPSVLEVDKPGHSGDSIDPEDELNNKFEPEILSNLSTQKEAHIIISANSDQKEEQNQILGLIHSESSSTGLRPSTESQNMDVISENEPAMSAPAIISPKNPELENKENTEVPEDDNPNLGIALLCDIVGYQYVDVQRSL